MSLFSDARLTAPPVPDVTCPTIDEVQEEVSDIIDKLKELTDGRKSPMEDLRDANSTLRESSQYWYDTAKEMQERIDVLEAEMAEMENENAILRQQLEVLS